MDPKVLQYIMGHADIAATMDVYNHITEKQHLQSRINAVFAK